MSSKLPHYLEEDFTKDEIDLKDLIMKYVLHWKWFLVSIVCFAFVAFIYVRYTLPEYVASSTLLVKDDRRGDIMSEVSAFQDLDLLGNVKGNVDNEVEILKSRNLLQKVAKELRLNFQFHLSKQPLDLELYKNNPINVTFLNGDSSVYYVDTAFNIIVNSETDFILEDQNGESNQKGSFDKYIKTTLGELKITKTSAFTKATVGNKIKVKIHRLENVVTYFAKKINVKSVNKISSVIGITLKLTERKKAIDIINEMIRQYDQDAIDDQNQISINTAKFIDDRVKYITSELSDVEGNSELFKTKHGLVDVTSEGSLFRENVNETGKEVLQVGTEIQLVQFMQDYLNKSNASTEDLMPSNLGLSDQTIGESIAAYNQLLLERNNVLENSGDKNPLVADLNEKLLKIKVSIKESLSNLERTLQIKSKDLVAEQNKLNAKIASVPKYEREFRIIQRQQQIKESLYLYLLQKREETALAVAASVSRIKIIDDAYSPMIPAAPKTKLIYLGAMALGLIFPFLLIYVKDLLDTKIHDVADLKRLSIPLIGEIPIGNVKNKLMVLTDDRSAFSEAFRTLRTNLSFMLQSNESKSKVVFITSSVANEGKSLIALNLASILSISDKKVVLVGMDLRAPTIAKYVGLEEKEGVSSFINSNNLSLEDVIETVPNVENLHLLPAGFIPPNPAELLMGDNVKKLFDELKSKYDYIIVDTPPVGIVTDALLLNSYADLFIYVARANVLEKKALDQIERLYKEERLNNMALVVNGTKQKKGYEYGYGNVDNGPFWKRLFS